ncbi:MAG TPA: hypothetical protein VGP96_17650 [Candidatus Dormibacteraeota bacterium]|jgi:hypothetical protein|nr:hypothetical protein [Candidatus Dormibacteraeota bacterium]
MTHHGRLRTLAAALTLGGALAVPMSTAVPAHAAAGGCTSGGTVCIRTVDSGLHVGNVEVRFSHVDGIIGHAHLFGPGYDVGTADQSLAGGFCAQGRCNPTTQLFTFHPDRNFPDGSLLCAEIWQRYDNGSYNLRGRPCVTIHA